MTPGSAALLSGAGLLAGAVNAAAGGGSLLSFPALLAVGHSPLVANVTNTVGLLPGYVGGTLAYRRELEGQGERVRSYGLTVVVGAVLGVALLLGTSESAFRGVAPVLVLLACALLAAQPRMTAALRRRDGGEVRPRPLLLHVLLLLGGVYASYFGAAVGVMLLAVLGLLLPDDLQRLNGVKGALSLVATIVGATAYLLLAPVQIADAAVLAAGSLVGGRVGGSLARRLPDPLLRGLVLTVGVVVALTLLL